MKKEEEGTKVQGNGNRSSVLSFSSRHVCLIICDNQVTPQVLGNGVEWRLLSTAKITTSPTLKTHDRPGTDHLTSGPIKGLKNYTRWRKHPDIKTDRQVTDMATL